jgi:SpoVK/Ycf46/Vps4 family AAA+-type ATPase
MEIAKALYFLGRIEDARHHFSAGIRDNPEAADADLSRRLNENEEGNRGLRIGQSERIPVGGGDISPSNFDGLQDTGLSFRDVGGMDALKETLRRAIVYPFRSPEIYRAYGRSIGGGILLYGPPGCGKTYIARATAGEIQARFISVGLSDIMDMWYGESERKLHDLFASARNQAPAVLFFDEVDALGHSRTRMSQFTAGRTLVNQFLAEMDGIQSRNENLLIIGATNSPWDVDPAFRRPGRFDRIIFVAPPDAAARVEILKVHCRNKPLDRIDFNRIVTQMDRFSGADIKNVCDVAADKALDEALKSGSIRKITTADFLEAIRRVKPSTSEWLETAHSYARYANTSGLYSEVEDYLQGR